MSEELNNLSSLGVQKIYEDTHIPAHHIQALLHNSFDGFYKVQFLGFISILEREYDEKLDVLKEAGLAYFAEKDERHPNDSLLVISDKKKTKAPLYISISVALFSVVLIFNYFILNQENSKQNKLDNTLIKNVQENIIAPKESLIIEKNTTIVEDNITTTDMFDLNLSEISKNEEAIVTSFKIVPRTKVWFGYIDVKTNKKHQTTLNDEIDLDSNKTWLLLFGHGYVDMFVNGEIQKFSSRNKTRFLYENQTLKAITFSEFKELNRGQQW